MRSTLILLVSTLTFSIFSANLSAQKMTVGDRLKYMDADENYQKEYWDAAYSIYRDLHLKYPLNTNE